MASILDMPAELVLHIIQDFGRDDLCKLRRTCRQMNEHSMNRFGTVAFGAIRLVPTLETLERLQKLANHETLKTFVQGVTIMANYLTHISYDMEPAYLQEGTTVVSKGTLPYPQARSVWQEYANEAAKLVSSGNIRTLLAAAFTAFDRLEVTVDAGRGYDRPSAWGIVESQRQDSDRACHYRNWDFKHPTVHAIICSETLDACYTTSTQSLRLGNLDPKSTGAMERPAQYISNALSSLRTLHLDLANDSGETQSYATTEMLLVRFLNSLPNLNDLTLIASGGAQERLFSQIFLNVRFVSLKYLYLDVLSTQWARLSLFVSHCKSTLVSLDLISYQHINLRPRISQYENHAGMAQYKLNVHGLISVLEQLEDSPSLKALRVNTYPPFLGMVLDEIKERGKYSLVVYIKILRDSLKFSSEITVDPFDDDFDYDQYRLLVLELVEQGLREHGHSSSPAQAEEGAVGHGESLHGR